MRRRQWTDRSNPSPQAQRTGRLQPQEERPQRRDIDRYPLASHAAAPDWSL